MMSFLGAPALPPIPHPPLTFGPVAPELILVGMALVLMLVDALSPKTPPRVHAWLALAGIAGAAIASVILWNWNGAPVVLGGMVSTDRFAVFFRLVILACAALAVPLSQHYLERTGEWRGEFYPLLLFATTGMTLIVASADLILVFLALEILSLSLYLLTGFSLRRMRSGEAAMKYFLLGAFSSAFFLYGIAMAYGATGVTNLAAIGHVLRGGDPSAFAIIAIGLLVTGFGFKVALVPFHMWTPDAYQGAPTPVTAFVSAATKVAAFAAFLRVFTVALGPLHADWRPLLAVLAAITLVVGSVLAIAQTNVKRMLAYSSIAHAGFILIGLSAGNTLGREGAMFYLASYAAMTLGAFGVVMLVSATGERDLDIADYRGLARRHPILGAALALFLLSLAGIPPTAGFISKATVFAAALQAGEIWLVVLAVIASVAAAFFYLRLIVLMYVQEDEAEPADDRIAAGAGGPAVATDRATAVSPVASLAIAIPAALTLAFGVFPQALFGVVQAASSVRF